LLFQSVALSIQTFGVALFIPRQYNTGSSISQIDVSYRTYRILLWEEGRPVDIALDWYKTFLAVAKCQSMSQASRALSVSQPAVSQTIRQLEHRLGAKLFVRHAKGMSLTEEGEALYRYVDRALALINAAQGHFHQLRELTAGQLRIGASDSLCKHWLLPRLERFHHAHPAVGIRVTNRTSSETMALLARGDADIGLVNLPIAISEAYTVREIARVQDCFVYSPRFYPHMPARLGWEELARMPLILLESASATRRELDALAAPRGVRWTPEIELGSLDLLVEFALGGLGVAAAVAEFVAPQLAGGALRRVELDPPIPLRAIGMVWHKEVPLPHAAKAFMEGFVEK